MDLLHHITSSTSYYFKIITTYYFDIFIYCNVFLQVVQLQRHPTVTMTDLPPPSSPDPSDLPPEEDDLPPDHSEP